MAAATDCNELTILTAYQPDIFGAANAAAKWNIELDFCQLVTIFKTVGIDSTVASGSDYAFAEQQRLNKQELLTDIVISGNRPFPVQVMGTVEFNKFCRRFCIIFITTGRKQCNAGQ